MKTTGVFSVQYYVIEVDELGEPIYLIPFGDIHKFARLHSDDHWRDFVGWARTKQRAYYLGMGDYMDMYSATERNVLKDDRIHDSTIKSLEELQTEHINEFYKDIDFMKDRCIGLIEGNHYAEFQNGTTSTQRLCELLNCKYLGVSSFIRLSLRRNGHKATVEIWAHHGKGAARLIGGSLNRVQQMGEMAEAQIYCMGHDHKKSVGITNKLKLSGHADNLKVVHKKQVYVRTGSFLRGYVDGQASYVADGCMNPTDLGVVKIELTPRMTHDDNLQIDIHASI